MGKKVKTISVRLAFQLRRPLSLFQFHSLVVSLSDMKVHERVFIKLLAETTSLNYFQ